MPTPPDTLVDTATSTTDTGAPDTAPDTGTPPPSTCASSAAGLVVAPDGIGGSFGVTVLLADATGDAVPDLVVGAPYGPGRYGDGELYVGSGADRGVQIRGPDMWDQRWWAAIERPSELGLGNPDRGDLDGDRVEEMVWGARMHPEVDVGRAWLLPTPMPGGGGHLEDAALAWIDGDRGDWLGQTHGIHADLTGDGVPDWSAGGPRFWQLRSGIVAVVDGAARGPLSLDDATARITGASSIDLFGGSDVIDVDQDGDGVAELVVSASEEWHPETETEGTIYWFDAPLVGDLTTADAAAARTGRSLEGMLGHDLDAGDLDGDGYPEVVVGAPLDDAVDWRAGRVYLVHGPEPGSGPIDVDTSWIDGEAAADQLGNSVRVLGDVDGDGTEDLAVGVLHNPYFQAEPGEVLIFHGPIAGALAASDASVRWSSGCPGDGAGAGLDARDVDGDGVIDLAVGAHFASVSTPGSGAAYLIFGADLGL